MRTPMDKQKQLSLSFMYKHLLFRIHITLLIYRSCYKNDPVTNDYEILGRQCHNICHK